MLVNYFIESLAITDIWIFLYLHALSFLNSRFPPVNPSDFLFNLTHAEPFEIPLYLVLSFLMMIFIYLFHHKINQTIKKLPFWLSHLVAGLLLVFFIRNLGPYPMGKDLFPLTTGENDLTNKVYLLGYLGFAGFLVIESGFLSSLIKKRGFLIIYFIFIVVLIAALTITPGFPISWHDYPYFWGPIYEVAHGKTVYTQIQSQYGFLAVIFPAVLYRLHLINLGISPILIWLLYIVQYFVCFYLVYKISRSLVFSLISLFSIITVNYHSLCCAIAFPQIGALRWLPIILLIFLFYKLKKLDSPFFIFVLSFASFWMIDTGIAILLAYGLTLFMLTLVKMIDIKRLIKDYLLLVMSLLLFFLVINVAHLVFGYQPINLFSSLTKLREFSRAGYGMLPIPQKSYFWLLMLIYFSSLVYFFRQKTISQFDQLLLLSANFGLFASVYYIGRSHPLNLFVTALFFLLATFIFIGFWYARIKSFNRRLIVLICLFLIFVAAPALARKEMLAINLKQTLMKLVTFKNPLNSQVDEYLNNFYQDEKSLISENLKSKKIFVLSSDDTYLLYLVNKDNLLDINPLTATINNHDIDFALKNVYKSCPKNIVVDCQYFNRCPPYSKLNFLEYPYSLIMDKVSKRCRLIYQPVQCTYRLCLTQAEKIK